MTGEDIDISSVPKMAVFSNNFLICVLISINKLLINWNIVGAELCGEIWNIQNYWLPILITVGVFTLLKHIIAGAALWRLNWYTSLRNINLVPSKLLTALNSPPLHRLPSPTKWWIEPPLMFMNFISINWKAAAVLLAPRLLLLWAFAAACIYFPLQING